MRRILALAAAASLAACGAPGATAVDKTTGTIVRGRFVGYKLEPKATVRILDCAGEPGSELIRKDGSFEILARDCAPGIHRLVFGKDGTGLLKFAIRDRITDVGTIEGGQ